MSSLTTIILAAKQLSDSLSFQDQMTPVRGKPALAWVVEEYLDCKELIIVINKGNTTTYKYLQNRFPNIHIVLVDENEELNEYGMFSILNSLNKALKTVETGSIQLVLGDTISRRVNSTHDDVILVSDDFSIPERWCLVDIDESGCATTFYDKENNIDTIGKFALVGFYQFSDINLLKDEVENALKNKLSRISDVLAAYKKHIPIHCEHTPIWFDLGHKSGIIKAQNSFFNSRDFNALQTNSVLGTITKTSSKIQKLSDEYAWYKNLPEEIQVISPRVVSFIERMDNASLTMEMYGYSALSELYLLGSLSYEEWQLIIIKLFDTHKVLERKKGELSEDNFYNLYYTKSLLRIKELNLQNDCWMNLFSYDDIIINNIKYNNIKYYKKKLLRFAKKLSKNVDVSIMHGDYCFSNILFDTNTFLCRLIDPRGRLQTQTIYGDPRYDIAKLRHSVVGCYDFAVHGLFTLSEKNNNFNLQTAYPPFYEKLSQFFDEQVVKYGYNLFEIKLIEASLFLSMVPLHKDNLQRQKFFYLKSVIKLNQLFGDTHE